MIKRESESTLKSLAKQYKVVGVIGPRQSGKTTLVKYVFNNKPYVNLENLDLRNFAIEDPRGFLSQYKKGAIFDEVQRTPELFSYIQQFVDDIDQPGIFILTGSNNFLLQENISQSLAGRIGYIELLPFSLNELPQLKLKSLNEVLLNGMYPPLYDKKYNPTNWYSNYVRTYIERDVRQIKNISNLLIFERFIKLCAGRIGQLLNMQSLAIEVGVDNKTINSWISVLESSFIIFRLAPHHTNFNKRVVKMAKLYFYDTGLACAILGIKNTNHLDLHPFRGNIFENFCLTELVKSSTNFALKPQLFFWRDRVGNEVDVLIEQAGNLYPIEIKSGKTITSDYFKGLNYWTKISGNSNGLVIYGGDEEQLRSDGKRVISWKELRLELKKTLDFDT